MEVMSWRNKGIPLAIFAVFVIQILAPMVAFPPTELPSKEATPSQSVSLSSGSGHDLQGDLISIDGKNWTVRGESVLDYWNLTSHDVNASAAMDLIVTEDGIGYAC